jgi:hypothetical protein
MKSNRTAAKAVPSPGKKPDRRSIPLPVSRLRAIPLEKLQEFELKYGPKTTTRPVDAVATLIRLRRGKA